MSNEYYHFYGEIVASTEKAALIQFDDFLEGQQEWVPWSQIGPNSIERDGQTGPVYISVWLCEEKGWV